MQVDKTSLRQGLMGSHCTSPSLTDTFSQRQCRLRSIQVMKQKKPYKTYTKEFKQEAVRLMEVTDRPASEIAMELGIRRNQLYKWKDQLSV
ncbi:MAG: transposase, partial [Spirochaetes bacterium]|nr:transposase [Spirochaetota bacterium]